MIDHLENEVEMLERHLTVLRMVYDNEPIGIVKISNETGYPRHKIRYSLRILEDAGLINPTDHGAISTDETEEFLEELDGKLDDISDRIATMKELSGTDTEGAEE